MQSISQVVYETSEQHVSCDGPSRIERDNSDINILTNYLEQSSPFEGDPTILRSISTGLTSSKNCNVHYSKAVGKKILDSMIGVSIEKYVFHRTEQAVLMTAKMDSSECSKELDPSLLFQRLLIILKGSSTNELDAFK